MSVGLSTLRPAIPGHEDIQKLYDEIWAGFAEEPLSAEVPSSDQLSSDDHLPLWELMQSSAAQLPVSTSNDVNDCESQGIPEGNAMGREQPRARVQTLDAAAGESLDTHLPTPSIPVPPNPVPRNSLFAPTSNRPIIDLRSPRRPHTLKDDIRCVERLSRPDQGHPHLRLALLWFISDRWCERNHALALKVWLGIIEGDENDDDLWLWEDGDETWINKVVWSYKKDDQDERVYSTPALLYPTRLRATVSALTSDEWRQAGFALECRLKRVQKSELGEFHEIMPCRSTFPRINAFAWLILQSKWMKYADQQRGKRRLLYQYDDDGLLEHWIETYHMISGSYMNSLSSLFFQEGHCSECRQWEEEQDQWMTMLSTVYPLRDIEAVCRKMIPCFEGCMTRYAASSYFLTILNGVCTDLRHSSTRIQTCTAIHAC